MQLIDNEPSYSYFPYFKKGFKKTYCYVRLWLIAFVRSFVCMMSFIGLLTLCLNGEMCLFHFFNSPSKSVWCE